MPFTGAGQAWAVPVKPYLLDSMMSNSGHQKPPSWFPSQYLNGSVFRCCPHQERAFVSYKYLRGIRSQPCYGWHQTQRSLRACLVSSILWYLRKERLKSTSVYCTRMTGQSRIRWHHSTTKKESGHIGSNRLRSLSQW